VWSVLVLVASLERWGAEVGSGPATEVGSGSGDRGGEQFSGWGWPRRTAGWRSWSRRPTGEREVAGGRRGDRVGAGARRGRGRWPASGGVEAKGAVPRAWVEVEVSLQCSGEERESPEMGGEGAVTAKRGKGSSSCWTPYSARFSLILGMRHWIQQLQETVLALKNIFDAANNSMSI
jgi:hypothetical protein